MIARATTRPRGGREGVVSYGEEEGEGPLQFGIDCQGYNQAKVRRKERGAGASRQIEGGREWKGA